MTLAEHAVVTGAVGERRRDGKGPLRRKRRQQNDQAEREAETLHLIPNAATRAELRTRLGIVEACRAAG